MNYLRRQVAKVNRASNFPVKKVLGGTVVIYAGTVYYMSREDTVANQLYLSSSRRVSQLTGVMAGMHIPSFLRGPLYGLYCNTYNVDREEIVKEMGEFCCFQEFFTRQVKERVISEDKDVVVSPADGVLIACEKITADRQSLFNIKSVGYSLGELLTGEPHKRLTQQELQGLRKESPDNDLYQMVFYLSPGDYHRFHSPADLSILRHNHILGHLYPVKLSYVKTHEGVYEGNERVALFGTYTDSKASRAVAYVMVGATNVGSILMDYHPSFRANVAYSLGQQVSRKNVQSYEKEEGLEHWKEGAVRLAKGQELGRFNLGSTIVMVMEVPKKSEVLVSAMDPVKYGQPVIRTAS